jgi:uncharacterized phage protein (TIGR02218 family)
MTRVITGGLGAHLAGVEAFPADCLMVQRRDGTRVGFTSLDGPVVADLGEGDETYVAGMTVTSLTLAVGLDASSVECRGPIGPVVTRAALLGGVWDDSEAWFFRASPSADGIAPLLHGMIREAPEDGEEFVFQVRGEADRLNQTIGALITPYCQTDFGSPECGYVIPTIDATVTDVTDGMRFSVSTADSYADGYFELGLADFTSGALAGDTAIEVFVWREDGSVELFEPMLDASAIGDTLTLCQGCAKTRAACMSYGNILNMRLAYPETPGSDQVLKAQVPDDAGA